MVRFRAVRRSPNAPPTSSERATMIEATGCDWLKERYSSSQDVAEPRPGFPEGFSAEAQIVGQPVLASLDLAAELKQEAFELARRHASCKLHSCMVRQ